MVIDKELKRKVFMAAATNFETSGIKEYFLDMSEYVPDYFFTMPSSTSGKYHNAQQCNFCGQLIHAFMIQAWIDMMLGLESIREEFPDATTRDLIRCMPMLHDSVKCGWNGSMYTVQDHPRLAANLVSEKHPEHDIDDLSRQFLAGLCAAHSGQWNTDRSGKEIMPKPRNFAEKLCHYADMTSSRKCFAYECSTEQDAVIKELCDLFGQKISSSEPEDLGMVKFSFGRYKNMTVKEVAETSAGREYLSWAVATLTDKPNLVAAIKSVLK